MIVESLGNVQAQAVVSAQGAVPTKAKPVKETGSSNATTVIREMPEAEKAVTVLENSSEVRPEQEQKNEQLQKAVEQLNKKLFHSEAIFGMHEETNRITIKIVDKETKEVLKEIPPEEALDMVVKGWELAGILVDEKR